MNGTLKKKRKKLFAIIIPLKNGLIIIKKKRANPTTKFTVHCLLKVYHTM